MDAIPRTRTSLCCIGMSTSRLRFISTRASWPPFTKGGVGEQWPTQLGKHHFSQMRGCNGQVRVSRNPVCACVISRKGWRRRTHQNGRHPRWSRTEAMRKGTSALWHCVSLSFDSLTAIYCWTNLLKSNKKCIFRIFKEMHIAPHTAVCQAPCLL